MDIKLQGLKPNRILEIPGPRLDVALQDDGQAVVTMTLTIGDGTHFHYPSEAPSGTLQSTTLARGDHDAVLRISAMKMEKFGRSYDSSVRLGGTLVATATGVLAENKTEDSGFKFFVIRVTGDN